MLLVTKGLDLGGIERVVIDLAGGLTTVGVGVDVAVLNGRRDQLVGHLAARGVPVHRLGRSDGVEPGAAWGLARLVRSRRFDIVHAHGPLPSAMVRCIPGSPPIVTTSHTLWRGVRASTRLWWRATAWRDAAALAVSSAVATSLPRSVRTTRVAPHGVDPVAIADARAAATKRSPQHPTAVTAICVASHRDVKNYPSLLRAVADARIRAPQLRLVAVGDGADLGRHTELAAELGLADHVSFVPATPSVLELMAAADLLVVASDFEGQPMVVSEAMALGLPVVATAVGRVPELVRPTHGRVVPPGDTSALTDALVDVASDADLRRSMGELAERSAAGWTLEQVVRAHVDIYRALLGR